MSGGEERGRRKGKREMERGRGEESGRGRGEVVVMQLDLLYSLHTSSIIIPFISRTINEFIFQCGKLPCLQAGGFYRQDQQY